MKTLIVLTDFSNTASSAAIYAAALTHQFSISRFILFNSYEFKPLATEIPMPNQVSMELRREESLKKLEDLRDELRTFVSENTSIELLATEKNLLFAVHSLSEQYHAELTVMGITGMSGFERAIIGSNTISVAREISTPLLLVPNRSKFEKINKVVFATDLKSDLQKSAIEIKNIITALSARLLLLNIEKSGEVKFNTDLINEQAILHDVLDNEDPEYYFNENEDIAAGILEFIKNHDVQLVIALQKKHGFFESIFHRSITKRLTYQTPIPLLLLQEGIGKL
ncbi:nucleotide-binding universal stress UspA family protein [Pedobacter sp. CG_S7]|uniref:universal stress protein n=1 Tax=Pedobacter sp. CG_S7 TaxID=3143930 RepID=UPI0033935CD7